MPAARHRGTGVVVAERELLNSGEDSHKVVLYFETIDGLYKLSGGVVYRRA
jgi:hypothetical protein